MKIAGIIFPENLLAALRDHRLVIFAGAGVSYGEPARLPSFSGLAELVAKDTGEKPQKQEREDAFLGRLASKGVDVYSRAVQHLDRDGIEPTSLHSNLLRLFVDVQHIRLVTTNFDLLFEKAAYTVYGETPEIFRAPALPRGNDFEGIVHVHGSIKRPHQMVLTDQDFGRAYLTEGWAREFLVELFRNITVLFVGYSHEDTVVTYLARALPESTVGKRFILTDKGQDPRWKILGIQPISFPKTDDSSFTGLYEGVRRLAEIFKKSSLDWQREVTDIAKGLPPIDDEEADIIEYSFNNEITTSFFTNAAVAPEWIEWLDKRKLLDALFTDGDLNKRDKLLVRWLVEHFANHNFAAFILCIAKHNMHISAHLWYELIRYITSGKHELDEKSFNRWISLILFTMPASVASYSLHELGEQCIKVGAIQSLLKIFTALLKRSLNIRPGFTPADSTDVSSPRIEPELKTAGDYHTIEQLWQSGLKPALPKICEQLLNVSVGQIRARYDELRDWGLATLDGDADSWKRSAIEPHEQDTTADASDVLIDMARDSIEWIAMNNAAYSNGWCELSIDSEVPLLRRLSVHALTLREDLTSDEKILWLLEHNKLFEVTTHHEVFRAVALAYPTLHKKYRRILIKTIKTEKQLGENPEDSKRHSAYYHYNWFLWLHNADPSCPLAEKAFNMVSKKYPQFQPREYPDLTAWTSEGWNGPQSPWSVDDLLAKPAREWLQDLLAFQPKDILGPDRDGLISTITDAAKQNFEWGIELAYCLAEKDFWNADLWHGLIRSWSEIESSKEKDQVAFGWLARNELFSEQARFIAEALLSLVKNGGKSYAIDLIPRANEIAVRMWPVLKNDEIPEESDHWLQLAINNPAGILAEFWVNSLSIWRKQQQPVPEVLIGDFRLSLTTIMTEISPKGRLGRSVIAGQIAFLLAVDETWTKEHLIPLFNPNASVAEYQAVWDGFLTWGRLNPNVAEILESHFLKAVQQLGSSLSNRRKRFMEYYTTMLCFHAEDPLSIWIPSIFRYGNIEDRQNFANNIENQLRSVGDSNRQEWWQRWLKHYWEDRVQGVPSTLDAVEIEAMLNWLPLLKGVFAEAVGIAMRMPKVPLQHGRVIHGLKENEIVKLYPESVAKLLLYLEATSPSGFFWFGSRDIIKQIVDCGLPPDLETKIKELEAKISI
jgi:hypothetical protein